MGSEHVKKGKELNMTIERAIEILNPEHKENYESIEPVIEACSWAHNEEMVDWLAIQFPKLYEAFLQADCI